MSFSELLNDSEVGKQLDTMTKSDRLPHAIVLESRDKELAQKIAVEISKVFFCSADIKPCGKCSGCFKAEKGIHPDLYRVEITDGKQAVGVGEIRAMISDCYIKPNEASNKVYFISDKMTTEAQNALLKILEEPPPGIKFVIISESSTLLLQTIRSRCTLFKLTASGSADENELNEKALAAAQEIAKAIPDNMELPLMLAVTKLSKDKALTQRTLEKLSEIICESIEEKYMPTGTRPQYIQDIARSLRRRSLLCLMDVIIKAQTMLSQNCNMNLLTTWLCANIRQSRHAKGGYNG